MAAAWGKAAAGVDCGFEAGSGEEQPESARDKARDNARDNARYDAKDNASNTALLSKRAAAHCGFIFCSMQGTVNFLCKFSGDAVYGN